MAKPWAKYEIDYINHDKFRAINANAICLWHEGKNYCDLRLTDGLIPEATAKHFRFYSKKTVLMLTTSCGLKPGTSDTYAPLWELVESFGFKMHDYLDHNDCREVALERFAARERQKQADADRKAEWRAAKKAKTDAVSDVRPVDVPPVVPAIVPPVVPCDIRDIVPHVPSMSRSIQLQHQHTDPERTLSESERAGRLLQEDYPRWYAEERNGARLLIVANSLAFQDALSIVAQWDDAHIEKLARIVLTTDDDWIANTDRSFKIFARKASWADDRLRQWEAKHAVGV